MEFRRVLFRSYASGRWWERIAAELAGEVYAVAPDLRGCGSSDKPAHGYSIPAQVADLRGLVAALGWEDFHLMAHSSSAAIAVDYSLNDSLAINTLTSCSEFSAVASRTLAISAATGLRRLANRSPVNTANAQVYSQRRASAAG